MFAIVSDQHKCHKQQAQGSASRKLIYTSVYEGDSSQPPPQTEQGSQAEANSILTAISQHQSGREWVQRDTFESNPTLNKNSHNADKEALKMPIRQNPCKNGLRRSPCLREKREQEEAKKRRAHVTFGTSDATKLIYGLFTLIYFTRNFLCQDTEQTPIWPITKKSRIDSMR